MCCSLSYKNNKMPWQRPRYEARADEEHVGTGLRPATMRIAQTLRHPGRRDILNHYFGPDSAKARPPRKTLATTGASKAPVLWRKRGGLSNEIACPGTSPHKEYRLPQTCLTGQTVARFPKNNPRVCAVHGRVARRQLEILRRFTVLRIQTVRNISVFGPVSAVSRRYV